MLINVSTVLSIVNDNQGYLPNEGTFLGGTLGEQATDCITDTAKNEGWKLPLPG